MEYTVDFAVRHSIISSYTRLALPWSPPYITLTHCLPYRSGEGLMCYFKGPGTIYVQSRNEAAFRDWVRPAGSAANNKQGPVGICQNLFGALISIIIVIVFVLLAVYGDDDK
jgi:hypothetical protein